MIHIRLEAPDDFEGWRAQARALAQAGVASEEISWTDAGTTPDLFATENPITDVGAPFPVPRAFLTLAESVICHSDPERFSLLYALLLRLRGKPAAMDDAADPLILQLEKLARHVRRDMHKMRAFLRFRELPTEDGSRYVAWFEPDHHIVRANAGFFVRRFASLQWSILTPALSVHWDGDSLCEGPAADRADAPSSDAFEEQWHAYYRSTFNPARLKVSAMLKEMPRKYWRNMPETRFVPELIRSAQPRTVDMMARENAIAPDVSLEDVEAEARKCRRCPLYGPATQLVFGEGPADARIMLVGEQPGHEEDLEGKPFIGPAGRVLDAALEEAGLDRTKIYVTNAVKHFKFETRGKRRIHQRPNTSEVDHCRWWLTREIALVQPDLIIALGATAARSVTGSKELVNALRNSRHTSIEGVDTLVTVHPSFLLRIPEAARAEAERRAFVGDLKRAKAIGDGSGGGTFL